jgi:hypothetical protein
MLQASFTCFVILLGFSELRKFAPSIARTTSLTGGGGQARVTLLSSCNLRGDNADVVDAGFMANVDYVGYGSKVQIGIALDEHHFGCASGKNRFQLR